MVASDPTSLATHHEGTKDTKTTKENTCVLLSVPLW